MSKKQLDLKKLEKQLLEIYNSNKRPNKAIEKKIREVIIYDED